MIGMMTNFKLWLFKLHDMPEHNFEVSSVPDRQMECFIILFRSCYYVKRRERVKETGVDEARTVFYVSGELN